MFIRALLLGTLALILVAGCGAPLPPLPAPSTPPPKFSRPAVQPTGQQILEVARRQLGCPYRYAGASPQQGFDCSGLAWYAHRQAGIRIPRRSSDQHRGAHPVSLSQLAPGDLIFFRISGAKVSHVGVYSGGGLFIHAPSRGRKVSYASLQDRYWRQRIVGAGRFY